MHLGRLTRLHNLEKLEARLKKEGVDTGAIVQPNRSGKRSHNGARDSLLTNVLLTLERLQYSVPKNPYIH